MKKMLLMVAVIAALWMVSTTAESAGWIDNCVVNSVGAGSDVYNTYVPIQMTCPGYALKNYSIKGSDMAAKNRVLATFLTALSTEKPVMVHYDDMAADPVYLDVVLVKQ